MNINISWYKLTYIYTITLNCQICYSSVSTNPYVKTQWLNFPSFIIDSMHKHPWINQRTILIKQLQVFLQFSQNLNQYRRQPSVKERVDSLFFSSCNHVIKILLLDESLRTITTTTNENWETVIFFMIIDFKKQNTWFFYLKNKNLSNNSVEYKLINTIIKILHDLNYETRLF